MSITVEQTIPFPAQALDLQNPTRWNKLFPLIRPTVKPVQTAKDQTLLVDTALASSKNVSIVALTNLGNFSSKILDERTVTAVETGEAAGSAAEDIKKALQDSGVAAGQGVVVVRTGKALKVSASGSGVVEVETEGEVQQDHVLHLLGHASESCRSSIEQTGEMLKTFAKSVSATLSPFHTDKVDGKPAVKHAEGPVGYSQAKEAIARDLKQVLQSSTAQDKDVVYSVHYSDVNGLSRLENYLLASEIAQFLDAQALPYRLSHSTVLSHTDLGRAFAISVAPIAATQLTAQAKPAREPASDSKTPALKSALAPTTSKIPFSDATVRASINAGCNAVIAAEPTITEYDTIVGDGDCGYTLRDGAKQVQSFIEGKDLSQLPATVSELVNDLEVNMGGTSGALYCIYLTALSGALASESSVPAALQAALQQLMKYTRARLGDRTMMDALIPFVETLEKSGGNVQEALKQASDGVEGTKRMDAKLGRSTYLDESATRGVPDPGAYGLLILLEGMGKGQ